MSQQAADAIVAEAHELFQAEKYADSAARYEKAAEIHPPHAIAWAIRSVGFASAS